MALFELVTQFEPSGDQPAAIEALVQGVNEGLPHQTLLGVTGSGKTFTVANVIARTGRPALILAHNKILAAQLYGEFKALFPNNAVEYFVSYYDYYQPEAYVPSTDTFIEKDSSVNDEIDKMRHAATRALLTREDVIIVASVSCIYGIGSPETYGALRVELEQGTEVPRDDLVAGLVAMQYTRNDIDFHRGAFRVRGDVVDVFPAYEADRAIRIELFGDEIESISEIDPLRGVVLRKLNRTAIFPGSHYATTRENLFRAINGIEIELQERLKEYEGQNEVLYSQRLDQRTRYDLEMMRELGYCSGIENYSRHLDGRMPGDPPYTLISYFPKNFLLIADESHMTIPQVGAMYRGDRSRKDKLVEYGFRLPCARDNRPLKFEEFEACLNQVIYISATPSKYELEKSEGLIVEQVVRPTGLVDPEVEVRPATNQVDDLLAEVRLCAERGERVLVTTLTKRMSEDLTDYFRELGVRVRYMHSDVETLERIELIRELRQGGYDVLVGINLLREGLDIPEVGLVAVLDADKEGFLRSETSLIQTCGRAARHVDGRVIMYADVETGSMRRALDEMNRRRKKQQAHNKAHKITPASIKKDIPDLLKTLYDRDYVHIPRAAESQAEYLADGDLEKRIKELQKKMKTAASQMDFEKAADFRDQMLALERKIIEMGL
ncbi:MAG: excinuclease ABC subunit UvrB [Candidatus Hydrogenedentes bacterium]|nr:excinuclease ABC subunit UvrB [Candidatus Hydrogenedentota bacterium]